MFFIKSFFLLVSIIIPLALLTSPSSTLTPVEDDIFKIILNSSLSSLTLSSTTGIVTVTLTSPVLNVAVSGVAL